MSLSFNDENRNVLIFVNGDFDESIRLSEKMAIRYEDDEIHSSIDFDESVKLYDGSEVECDETSKGDSEAFSEN